MNRALITHVIMAITTCCLCWSLDENRTILLENGIASIERSKSVALQYQGSVRDGMVEDVVKMLDDYISELRETAGKGAYRPGGRWEKKRKDIISSITQIKKNGKDAKKYELKLLALDYLIGLKEVTDFAEIKNVSVF